MEMLDPTFKAKWLEALRSGEYQQCQNQLKSDDGYCCIGVAAVIAGYGIDSTNDRIIRPGQNPLDAKGYSALEDFGLCDRTKCIHMNDTKGKSFLEIADFIEENL